MFLKKNNSKKKKNLKNNFWCMQIGENPLLAFYVSFKKFVRKNKANFLGAHKLVNTFY